MSHSTRGLLVLFLIGISGLQADPSEPKARKTLSDQERIEGVWIFVTLTEKHEDWMFLSSKIVGWRVRGNTTKGKVVMDATKTPKQIDLTFPKTKDRPVHLRGVFQFLEDDLLAICVREDGARPNELKATEKQNIMLFKRAKQEIPAGHYKTTVNGNGWTLDLNDHGSFTLKGKGEVMFEGAFNSNETEIEVLELKEPRAGQQHSDTGKYGWTMDRNLSFNKIDDECTDRATAMTSNPWVRMK